MKLNHLFAMIIISYIYFHNLAVAQSWNVQASNTTQQLKGLYAISETEVWACGDGGVILHTLDAGTNWAVNTLTGADLHSIVFKDALTGIVVGDGGTIFRTMNAGVNWMPVTSSTSSQLRAADWGDGDVVWAAGRDGAIVKSIDGGQNWSALNSGSGARFRGIAATGINTAWAVGEGGIIKYTVDGGTTWITQQSPATDDLHDVQFLTESVGFSGGSNSEVIFANDGGQNWVLRSNGIAMGINGIYFLDENNGWAVSDFGTIYITSNGGMSWVTQPSNTTQTLNEIYFRSANLGWAVGDLGTIIHFSAPVTDVESEVTIAGSYQLSQNYPNPFNPITNITYTLPEESFVSIKIYNTLGKEVAELVKENKLAGDYKVEFNALDFSSGVYIYQINAGDFVETKTMVLMK